MNVCARSRRSDAVNVIRQISGKFRCEKWTRGLLLLIIYVHRGRLDCWLVGRKMMSYAHFVVVFLGILKAFCSALDRLIFF